MSTNASEYIRPWAALLLVALVVIGSPRLAWSQYTLSGHVYEAADGEALPGATVAVRDTTLGTTTNAYGFFSLTVDEPRVTLRVSFVGFVTRFIEVDLLETGRLDVILEEEVITVEDIVVTADRYELTEEVTSTRMGLVKLTPNEITAIPTIGGEADLIKVAQLLPGVASGNEGSTGMFVRGGTDDQNLVVLDEAVVYNIGHLFGFFSVFNTDAIKDVQVIKGAFPARYGGRLSSVVDVRMNEGSSERYKAEGGVGILTSRLTVDGPISSRASFMVAGRRTYIDKVFGVFGIELPYYFYDVNAKVNYKLGANDRLFVSSYFGNDVLSIAEETQADTTSSDDDIEGDLDFGFKLGNFTSTVRWNHIYPSERLFSNVTLHQTGFRYDIRGSFVDNQLLIRSRIQDLGLTGDWEFFRDPATTVSFGGQALIHWFRPNVVSTAGEITEFLASQRGDLVRTSEWVAYAGVERSFGDAVQVDAGMRLSASATGGKWYAGPEPRISARIQVDENSSVKASYSLMRQYMHRVSSSSIALPTDLWYPVTRRVRPQRSHLVSAGYTRAFHGMNSSVTAEVYYKSMANIIAYREGASLILNDSFEDELLAGSGRAYGAEVLVRKQQGRWSGWLSYALARADRRFDLLNNGVRFPAKFDRRHTFSFVSMVDLNDRVTFSTVWTYSSGGRFTAQNGQFLMPDASYTGIDLVPVYTARNAVELAPSHRLDINFIVRTGRKGRFRGEWHFGAYNFYNRASPFRVAIRYNGASYQYVQQGLFGFIPSVSYNFKLTSQ